MYEVTSRVSPAVDRGHVSVQAANVAHGAHEMIRPRHDPPIRIHRQFIAEAASIPARPSLASRSEAPRLRGPGPEAGPWSCATA